MSVPCDNCHHDGAILVLKQRDEHMMEMIKEIREDIKSIKKSTDAIQSVELEHSHTKDDLDRAFGRIVALEQADKETRELINQFVGMKKLAWALWSLLASGLGVVIVKLFVMSGAGG